MSNRSFKDHVATSVTKMNFCGVFFVCFFFTENSFSYITAIGKNFIYKLDWIVILLVVLQNSDKKLNDVHTF